MRKMVQGGNGQQKKPGGNTPVTFEKREKDRSYRDNTAGCGGGSWHLYTSSPFALMASPALPPPPLSPREWEALTPPLSEWMLDAVSVMGFARMTPVQAATIPLFMGHKDVVVEAVTGSGKTLAFLIPIVERLLRLDEPIKKHHVGAIVVSPTRELAVQIYQVLLSLLAFHAPSAAALSAVEDNHASNQPLSCPLSTLRIVPQLLFGGVTAPAQDLSTFLKRSPNFLISTPGRLLELLSSPHVYCPQSSFEVLVLDEADKLLDLGFKEDLQKVLARLPKQRRTGLFSASVSEALDQIVRVGLRNPVKVAVKVRSTPGVGDKRTPASLQLTYLLTPPTHKLPALKQLLSSINPTPQKSILYFSNCGSVDYYGHERILPFFLPDRFVAIPLHGKLPPKVRQKNFTRFTNATDPSVLLATDVAARGLDIPSIDVIIQIDPPTDPKTFLHRCGRAGRAGRRGLSILFLSPGREEDYIPFLEVRKTPVTPLQSPPISISAADAITTTKGIQNAVLHDRSLHDKAQRAFVSWVRSYSKHQASSIFRVADLDWEELGRAWGLLRLPKMPELKAFTGDKNLSVTIDWDNYSYRDKNREKHRKEMLNARTDTDEHLEALSGLPLKRPAINSVAWSRTSNKKRTRDRKREIKRAVKEKERWCRMTEEEKEKFRQTERMLEEVREAVRQREGSTISNPTVNPIVEEEFEGFG